MAAPKTEPINTFLARHWSDPGTVFMVEEKSKLDKQNTEVHLLFFSFFNISLMQ